MKTNGLVIPGCWGQWSSTEYYAFVNWRFCGGFYLGDRDAHLQFHQLYKTYYAEFSSTHLTWEVNFWAWLEDQGHFHPDWYYGDHNDSMITLFPNRCFAHTLTACNVIKIGLRDDFRPDFHPSSMAHIVHEDREWLNVRNVNYTIGPNHCYHISGPKITTLNSVVEWPVRVSKDKNILVSEIDWQGSESWCDNPMSYGLEDLRLWHDENGRVRCCGTNWDHTLDNCARIAVGHYDVHNAVIHGLYFPGNPTGQWEKNWAPFENSNRYVYKWSGDHVFTGCIESIESGSLQAVPITRPNSLFQHLRGSSVFLPTEIVYEWYIGVVHYSETLNGKKIYYHMMVKLDGMGKLKSYTDPFLFLEPQIEFCIGYHWNSVNRLHRFWVSKNDDCPYYIEAYDDEAFNWHTLPDDVTSYKQQCLD